MNNEMSASATKLWLVTRIVALIQDGRENEAHALYEEFSLEKKDLDK